MCLILKVFQNFLATKANKKKTKPPKCFDDEETSFEVKLANPLFCFKKIFPTAT